MNIPENILQAVADAAFGSSKHHVFVTQGSAAPTAWSEQNNGRRAVIQHALDNPALAPHLNVSQVWPPVGKYTDEELVEASNKAFRKYCFGPEWRRAFLAALPRRESPDLAQAIARAEKAEAECLSWKGNAEQAWQDHAKVSKELGEAVARAEKAEAELSSQLGILRPISEMPETVPETVPETCVKITGFKDKDGDWIFGSFDNEADTHGAILRLPSAEATPPAEPEPAAHVPLGPEDIKPDTWLDINGDGEIVRVKSWGKLGVINDCRDERRRIFSYDELFKTGSKINTSLPDTGRWDKDAWRPCSKPGK